MSAPSLPSLEELVSDAKIQKVSAEDLLDQKKAEVSDALGRLPAHDARAPALRAYLKRLSGWAYALGHFCQ